MIFITIPAKLFAETNTSFSQSVYDYTFIQNSTDFLSESKEFSSYYLLAGEKDGYSLFSKIYVNLPILPQSDIWEETSVDSAKLKLLVVFTDGFTDRYFLIASVCVDDFKDQLTDRWLRGISTAQSFATKGGFQTEDCKVLSPQDSVIINKNEIPKIFELEVTNLTRELIELKSPGLIYVITATPINNETQDYSRLPQPKDGIVGIASKSFLETYGSNTVATLSVSYSVSPTQFSENWNTFLVVMPGFLGVIVPLAIYILKQNKERKDLLIRATTSVSREIAGNEAALRGDKEYQVIKYDTTGKEPQHVRYTNAFLDDDAYNSVVASGQFNHLLVDTQDVLRELYTRIKDHNQIIRYTNELEDKLSFANENKHSDVLTRYDLILTRLENEIMLLLEKAKEELIKDI